MKKFLNFKKGDIVGSIVVILIATLFFAIERIFHNQGFIGSPKCDIDSPYHYYYEVIGFIAASFLAVLCGVEVKKRWLRFTIFGIIVILFIMVFWFLCPPG